MVIWVTGISDSGKTTLCQAMRDILKPDMNELVVLDGDAVRAAFGQDLGHREEDRVIQIRRLQNIAKLLSEQGQVVIVAALYANPELLAWNRENIAEYFEVYLDVPLEIVRQRDSKGLYAKVDSGQMKNVVGIDIPWQAPDSPDLVIFGNEPEPPEDLALRVILAVPRLSQKVTGALN